MYSPRLETERLILRRYELDDIDIYHEITTDPRLLEFCYYPDTSREYEEKRIKDLVERADNNRCEAWVIERKEDTKKVGKINVNVVYTRYNFCEVGYTIKYDYWGYGYAAEALSKVAEHLLNDIGYHLVECVLDETNIRSIRVVEKAGFKKDGYIENRKPNVDGTYHGILHYSKSKEQ